MTHKLSYSSYGLHERLPAQAPRHFPGKTALKHIDFPCSATLWRLGGGPEYSLERNIGLAVLSGDHGLLRSLAAIIAPLDPAFSSALLSAIRFNQRENFDFLLPLCDPALFKSRAALRAAAARGLVDFVNILAPLSISGGHELSAHRTCPVEAAAENGHLECVEALLPFLRCQDHSLAVVAAARNGHRKCIEALLPYSNPNANSSTAISMAIENGHADCVNLLMPFLLSLSAEAISESAEESRACRRNLAASRLALISTSMSESLLLAQAASKPAPISNKNQRL